MFATIPLDAQPFYSSGSAFVPYGSLSGIGGLEH
jgi:hypothetical protein